MGEEVGADLKAIRDRGHGGRAAGDRGPQPRGQAAVLDLRGGDEDRPAGDRAADGRDGDGIDRPPGRRDERDDRPVGRGSLRSLGVSYMPEGLEKQIDVPAMADLLAYLNSIK